MPQDHIPHSATSLRHADARGRRPSPRYGRILATVAAVALLLPGITAGQRQMHDAKGALSMLDELRLQDELSDDAPGCDRYVRRDYVSNREGELEAELIAELGGIYSPYTDEWFAKPTETDIEHIVAASEAHRSGMCLEARAGERKFLGRDHLNLTLAGAILNRDRKIDCDATDWLPAANRCWFAARVVKVKHLYDLAVDQAEHDALRSVLEECVSVGMGARSDSQAERERTPVRRYETCGDLYEDYPCGLRSYHERRLPHLYTTNAHLRTGGAICGRPVRRQDGP